MSINGLLNNHILISEWDWGKNKKLGIEPDKITYGSIKKVYWKCALGHEWIASPNNRSKGQGCPVCSGRKVEVGFNDLQSQYPEIAKEWHPILNDKLLPTQVTSGLSKSVWWKCSKCGNEWKTSISNRKAGKGCPVCGKIKQGLKKEQNIIALNGSFADNYPELLSEWDYDKNSISPYNITKDSTKRVWWKCKTCLHSWQTTVLHRTRRKMGCPACANKATTINNCLETTVPHILKKWNFKRNIDTTPRDVTAGSNKKVWWICENGHEWQATVHNIVNGGMCPVCCGQRVQVGYNDLATVNPRLAKEWHPTKNGDLLPTHITHGSRKKVWWICPKGHEYEAKVSNRSNGTGCPICNAEQKTSFPEQAIFFYLSQLTTAQNRYLFEGKTEIDIYIPQYNTGIEYDGYYYHSGINAEQKEKRKDDLLRSKGIRLIRVKEVKELDEYTDEDDIIYCKNSNNYDFLKIVIEKIVSRIGISDSKCFIDNIDIKRDTSDILQRYIQSEKENSVAIKSPHLAKEWHPTKNGYITPDMVSYSSAKKIWWLGKCGHEWQMSPDARNHGQSCPICSGKQILIGFNDLATTHPELILEWDFSKNNSIKPTEITYGSTKKVWWLCSKGHSYQATISNRSFGKNCPYCSNRKVLKGYNDLASQYPEIAIEWNYSRNNQNPDSLTSGSNKKVWWKCSKCGYEWITTPNHRIYRNSGCPACSRQVATPDENLMIVNPRLCKEWNYIRNVNLPNEYRPQSSQKVWWVCSICGYEWNARISERSKGTGCPCCAGKKVVKGINDLATLYPKLAAEWDYEKNIKISPENVTIGTHKKVWWKCSICAYRWQTSVANRSKGRGCPICSRKATTKSKEKAIFQYSPYGDFIKEYSSIKDAQIETGIKVINPCSQEKKTAGGFIWLLQRDDDRAHEIADTINQSRTIYKTFPVLQYSLNGIFIKRYTSSGEAERINGIAKSKVGACCRGKRKTAGGYIWKYDIKY